MQKNIKRYLDFKQLDEKQENEGVLE